VYVCGSSKMRDSRNGTWCYLFSISFLSELLSAVFGSYNFTYCITCTFTSHMPVKQLSSYYLAELSIAFWCPFVVTPLEFSSSKIKWLCVPVATMAPRYVYVTMRAHDPFCLTSLILLSGFSALACCATTW